MARNMTEKMAGKILILGGTREAAELAADLVAEGHDVTTSLAGRTKEPEPLAGQTRIGGFSSGEMDGAEGLACYLSKNGFTRLVDATHPFAMQISRNAVEAARLSGITFEVRRRPPWKRTEGDNWIEVDDLDASRDAIPAGARVLLALGSQHIDTFAARDDVHFIIRMVDQPERKLPLADHELVLGKPPADTASEIILLKSYGVTHIVCRNSGGKGAYAKIEAARSLGLPVIIVGRQD